MKTMNKIAVFALLLALSLTLCACGGGKPAAKDIDLEALGAALVDSGAFTDMMSQPAESVPGRIYGFAEGDVTKCVMYTGTGATAEEIFLAEAANADAAKSLADACGTRVENQKRSFESYVPEELVKLDDAVLVTAGNYVLFVVANDSAAARSVVESYTGS